MSYELVINSSSNEVVTALLYDNKLVEIHKEGLDDRFNVGDVYLRGFGSFVVKKRAEKTGRDISKNTTIIIPEHYVPTFKPAKTFVEGVKNKNKKK